MNSLFDRDTYIQSHWRPLMAVAYMVIVLFDFVVAPVFWGVLIAFVGGDVVQWQPLTLGSSGLFHVTAGSVLGVSAFTRGQEKIKRTEKVPSEGQ
jgi:hypothetical protein